MIPVMPPPPEGTLARRFVNGARHPVRYIKDVTGEWPVYPLLVLFGLNVVDELDRTAFGVLLPNIQEEFGLDLSGILTVVAVVTGVALLLQIPIAYYADRSNRVHLALVGAMVWSIFSVGTGLAIAVWMLYVARIGSGLGRAVVDPTHNSLLADFYPVQQRPRVYSFHRAANAVGQFLGPLLGGLFAFYLGWRAPFFIFAVPTVIVVILALRLREPVRGAQERAAIGGSAESIGVEESPPSFAESWRMVNKVESLRRIFYALPFLAAALVGFVALGSLKYESLGLDERGRGMAAAAAEPFALLGLYYGARIGTRLIQRDPGLVLRFISVVAFVASAFAALFAFAPAVWVAVLANIGISITLAIVGPGVLASLSLAIPPRARSMGFSMGSLWVLPGVLIVLPLVGAIGDAFGISWGMALMTPVFVIGGLIVATAGNVIARDIKQVWTTAAARSEVLYDRRQGKVKLLLARQLNVSYGDVQVLFDVDFEIDEGEIVALLGTNGAGKSTLLKAICGVVQADKGAVIFDGRDVTHAPPNEIAAHGITMVPGGQGTFPSLTVGENLRVAGWLDRRKGRALRERTELVLDMFPVLRVRLDHPAADLSGGQQQMLALGMAFLARPRLLMIDELSLGLAPVVVEQLLPVVRAMRDQGTTVILVEQSVNVALTLAETAYFMEKGEIRFHGPTAELLARPDILRSVFLEGAAAGMEVAGRNGEGPSTAPTAAEEVVGPDNDRAAPAPHPAGGDTLAPALEVDHLSVAFGGIQAVDRVSLSVAPGEIVGIIGPNGAGKTTLFDLISGYLTPSSGDVVLGGVELGGRGPDARARRGLGRSFQDARLFPAMTVEETLAVALERWVEVRDPFNAALRLPVFQDSESSVAGRVDELIDLLGLGAFRSKFVRELSTGSRRVVDLACVVAHRPSVVLLDEPSSGIAQREAEALAPLLSRIRDTLGASLLVIEHDMPLVTSVADRMVALDQGRVIAEGAPPEVLAHPAVVASYLGDNQDVIARSGSRTE
jgi:ABC-type branched-subunit amino acid transport system ATPase component/predicted MFS family arabinose efflux permease